jgi:hypothetical protein
MTAVPAPGAIPARLVTDSQGGGTVEYTLKKAGRGGLQAGEYTLQVCLCGGLGRWGGVTRRRVGVGVGDGG